MAIPAVTCTDNPSLEALILLLIRDAECLPYVDCDTIGNWQSLAKDLFSVLADGTMALNVCSCDSIVL